MKRLLLLLLTAFASQGYAQTYATAIAKMDHIYIGESYAGGASTTLDDEVGAEDATLVGGDNVEDLETTGPTAWLPTALQFDGTNDYLTTVGSIGVDNVTDCTVFVWLKRDVTNVIHSICGDVSLANVYYRFDADDTNLELNYNSTESRIAHGTTTDAWHSYGFVHDDSAATIDLYVDGVYVTTTPANHGGGFQVDNIAAKNGSANPFDGAMAQFMICDEALSAGEIAALDAGPSSTGNPDPLTPSIPGGTPDPLRGGPVP